MDSNKFNLKLLSDEECQNINGGFFPVLILGATIAAITVPVAKNIWNSGSGAVKLPGGIEAKWEKDKANDSKEINDFKKELNKLEQKMCHLIPPFYEF